MLKSNLVKMYLNNSSTYLSENDYFSLNNPFQENKEIKKLLNEGIIIMLILLNLNKIEIQTLFLLIIVGHVILLVTSIKAVLISITAGFFLVDSIGFTFKITKKIARDTGVDFWGAILKGSLLLIGASLVIAIIGILINFEFHLTVCLIALSFGILGAVFSCIMGALC